MTTKIFFLISFLFTIFPGTAFSDEINLETIPQNLSYTLNVIYEKANCQAGEVCSPHTIGLSWNHPLKTDGLQTYAVYKNDEKQPDQLVFNPSNVKGYPQKTDDFPKLGDFRKRIYQDRIPPLRGVRGVRGVFLSLYH